MKPVHAEIVMHEGREVQIDLYFKEEHTHPDDTHDYQSPEERATLLDNIDRGVWLWFCAHATASVEGIELGGDYLGACCYASVKEFIAPGGYWDDMKGEVLRQVSENLEKLAKVKA